MAVRDSGLARRDLSEDEILLNVLDAVERDRFVTQRSVARDLGIALGLANAYLKRCVRKGLIKIGEVPPRRYAYYLTPQGFAEKSRLTASYLAHSFSFFRRARLHCGEVFAAAAARGQRRLALIGAGDLAEVAVLVARDHDVELVGILPAAADAGQLARDAARLDAVDAVVVTALESPREVFDAALAAFGPARVHAPKLLRLPAPAPAADPPADRASVA